jgi:hypothetical protein
MEVNHSQLLDSKRQHRRNMATHSLTNSPWRAPGMAPVEHVCGMAGGSPVEVFNAGAYNTTIFAKSLAS